VIKLDNFDIAIIGGGFSGMACALQAYWADSSLRICIVDPSPRLPAGTAFAKAHTWHLLNVRADGMSIKPSEPHDFVDFLCQHLELSGAEACAYFAPRQMYANYLHWHLTQALANGAHISHIETKVERAQSGHNGHWRLFHRKPSTPEAAPAVELEAKNLIIATGATSRSQLIHARYFDGPWALQTLPAHTPDQGAAIIGAGLTAADCVQSLLQLGWRGAITLFSPRGVLAQVHQDTAAQEWKLASDFMLRCATPVKALRTLRAEISSAAQNGQDWRDVVNAIRPFTSQIFSGWSADQRLQFLRHCQPRWANARHRMPTRVFGYLAEHQARFRVQKARATGTRAVDDQTLAVNFADGSERQFQLVIDARGQSFSALTNSLLTHLHQHRALKLSDTGLGVQMDVHLQASRGLYALGALCFGELLETTAVPEIARQAHTIARHITRANAMSGNADQTH
jgi:uncharacterized NAD(P)/FAD-binding protein YdhS